MEKSIMNDETHYRLLKLIETNPAMSQRDLADAMGVSLGKINYCMRAVIARGLVKVKNFTANPNKRAYAYYLTPKGMEEKTRVTTRFLASKMREYEELKREIARLKNEVKVVGITEADIV
jgi:EPS-associated MarR family transcriptional regulator